MSALENQIPTLPISSENAYYTYFQNNTKILDIYLKNIDIFKEQMLLILQNITKDIKILQETAVTDPIVLPISAANVNYTKADESTVPLDTYLAGIVTDIQTTNNKEETDIETRLSSLEENLGSEDYLPIVPYKEQIDDYLHVFPKYLCTNFSISTLSSTKYSLFNFYNIAKTDYPGIKITAFNSATDTLFDINRKTNDIHVGTFNLSVGTVKIGGNNLELYSTNGFIIKSSRATTDTISSDGYDFKISPSSGSPISFKYGSTISFTESKLELTGSSSSYKVIISNGINLLAESNADPLTITSTTYSSYDIKTAFGMQFEDDGNNLIIRKPGNSSYGVKLPWTRL
jgi:hypothetical protein